jgi:hypothetical protein
VARRRRKQGETIRVLTLLAVAVLVTGLHGVGSVQAATISKPGITATVTAAVTPTRLPADGTAPVTLTLDASVTHSDRTTCLSGCASLRAIEVRPDRRVTVDTEGLPTCQISDVNGFSPSQARRKCGRALIGSGATTETVRYPEVAPFEVQSEQLFFNAGKGGGVLMYTYASGQASSAGLVGTIAHLQLQPNSDSGAAEVSFQFTFGKTWRYRGERHSYLNGQCRAGALKTQVTLRLADGSVASDASPQRCTKRG